MKTLQQFNPVNLKKIREAINNRLSFLELDYNIKIKFGNISYGDNNFSGQVKCDLVVDGKVMEAITSDFENYKDAWGLKFPLGFTFHDDDSIYKVVGLKTRNRKFPIICESLGNGKRYKLTRKFINLKYEEKEGGA